MDTPYARNITKLSPIVFEKSKIAINKIFKIIGAADAAANLLWEFNIPEKKDARHINNKNGKVILVKVIAKSILSEFSLKPGAIRNTKSGINISINRTKKNKIIVKNEKILVTNLWAFFLFLDSSEE